MGGDCGNYSDESSYSDESAYNYDIDYDSVPVVDQSEPNNTICPVARLRVSHPTERTVDLAPYIAKVRAILKDLKPILSVAIHVGESSDYARDDHKIIMRRTSPQMADLQDLYRFIRYRAQEFIAFSERRARTDSEFVKCALFNNRVLIERWQLKRDERQAIVDRLRPILAELRQKMWELEGSYSRASRRDGG